MNMEDFASLERIAAHLTAPEHAVLKWTAAALASDAGHIQPTAVEMRRSHGPRYLEINRILEQCAAGGIQWMPLAQMLIAGGVLEHDESWLSMFDTTRLAVLLRLTERGKGRSSRGRPQQKPVLVADPAQRTITYKGQVHNINSVQAVRWVKVLFDNHGRRIAAADLPQFDAELNGARPQDFKQYLPLGIRKLIDTNGGHGGGSRLMLPRRELIAR